MPLPKKQKKIKFTPEQKAKILREINKCKKSPVYFMKKYCVIQTLKGGKIPFNVYDFQAMVLDILKDNEKVIINKSRQLGISTLMAGFALWLTLFFSDKSILVIATKQTVAANLVAKTKMMYNLLPLWLRTLRPVVDNNKLTISFNNDSFIKATASSEDAGRSESLSYLFVDEAAFIRNADTIWTAAQPTLSTGGRAVLFSTPNGTGNLFARLFTEASGNIDPNTGIGKNGFRAISLPWTVHPDRNQAWRDKQDLDLGPRMAKQECVSGDSIIKIKDNVTGIIEEITIVELINRIQND